MPTDDIIDLLTIVPLWAVVAFRIYSRPKSPGQWAIFWTFVALAAGATLRLTFIEHGLITLTGIRDMAVLPKHLLVMLSCVLLLGWVESAVPPRDPEPRWRRFTGLKYRMGLFVATGIIATVAFPYARPSVKAPDGSYDFITPQLGDPAGTLHMAMYLLPMGIALSMSAALCFTAARRSDARLMKLCMGLMGAGATAGALYPLYNLSMLLSGIIGWTYPLSEAQFHRGAALMQMVTIILVIAGSSVRAADALIRTVRYRRALLALRPLWQELASILPPDQIRQHFENGTSLKDDRRRLRDLYGRLDERVVEISDACHMLLPWVSDDLPAQALEAVHALGLQGADAEAAQEALCLRVARIKAVDGEPYATLPAVSLLSLPDDTLASALWLARVAEYYTSPQLADAVTTFAGHHTLQEASA
ncbi:MAB_1171c family putative transporter [Streptomyces sp. NPDC001635]